MYIVQLHFLAFTWFVERCDSSVVSWYPSLLLCGGVHSVQVAEAMLGPILLQSIPDEPPETRSLWCPLIRLSCVLFTLIHSLSRLWVRSGVGHPFVCLGGLVARCSVPIPALVASRSVLSGLPQSSHRATVHPTVFLTPGAFYSSVSGLLRDIDSWLSRRSHLSVYLLFSRLSSTETLHLCISRPFRDCPKPWPDSNCSHLCLHWLVYSGIDS